MSLLTKTADLLKPAPKSVPPSLEQSVNEAASAALNKQQKLMLADQAIVTKQMSQIANDEMISVRMQKAKHGLYPNVQKAQSEDMSDIIVCDDYHKNDPQPTRIWPVIAALLAGTGLGVGGILGGMAISKATPQPPTIENKTIENTSGFLLDAIQAPRPQ